MNFFLFLFIDNDDTHHEPYAQKQPQPDLHEIASKATAISITTSLIYLYAFI